MQASESPKNKGKIRAAFVDSDSSSDTETFSRSVRPVDDLIIDRQRINKVISSPAYVQSKHFASSKHNPLQRRDTMNRRKSIMFIKGDTKSRIIEDVKSSEDEVKVDSDDDDDYHSESEGGEVYKEAFNSTTALAGLPPPEDDQATSAKELSKIEPVVTEQRVFRRGSTFIQIWNGVLVICILLDLIVIPLEVSTLDVLYIGPGSLAVLVIVQLIYLMDIYVCFNKTYYTENVKEVTDKIDIGLRYFSSTAFFFDLLSCAPVLACFQIYYKSKGYNQLFLLIRFCKGFKLKEILVEFHQRFYISSKLYFLGYLASVLIIVDRSLT